jgi:hypothetical protein
VSSVSSMFFVHLVPEAIFNSAVGFVILYFIKRYNRC